MLQLTQKLGTGEMAVLEVPLPQVNAGFVLVRTHYSIISGGTEGSTVSAARKSLLGKARERPQQVKQVLDTLKSQGPVQTYRAVVKKLDAYSPLGYSCAGEVIQIGEGVSGVKVGDLVACAGAGYANHAEVVAVPINLCVKLAPDANLRHAAYNTLGAISMQGVRQADLRVGETCVVIGLGLLGQLACLILRASGVHVIGVDVVQSSVDYVLKNGIADRAFVRNEPGINEKIVSASGGYGSDAVIIAAATDSTDPINFAGEVSRRRGRVVVLGAVPTGFDRDPHWYRKELELRMACSYGPGRYDPQYEEKGIDYPVAYVRWTEKRNMEAFQRLIDKGSIPLDLLTTHEFALEDAPAAFEVIARKTEYYIGIALRYDASKPIRKTLNVVNNSPVSLRASLGVSFIGAGSYAQSHLLPNIPACVRRIGVLANSGTTSKRVAEKFGFSFCTSEEADLLTNETDAIFIATRHDSHAKYVLKSLAARKHVFVEKPLCLNLTELEEISAARSDSGSAIMVGFNRRFSPLIKLMKRRLGSDPMSLIYRVNAGAVPADSWLQDMELGGGRIVGEACHFIDLLVYLNGSLPKRVSAMALPDRDGLNDSVNISIQFQNGSTGVVAYYANGPKSLAKEYLEVFSSGRAAILKDFRELVMYAHGKTERKRLWVQDKGQQEMVKEFLSAVSRRGVSPIPYEEIRAVTKTSLLVLQSLRTASRVIEVND